jgi:hypothetical protein
MKKKAKKKTTRRKTKAGFPKVLYIEDEGADSIDLYLYKTPEEVMGNFQNGHRAITVGIYELTHMARVTTEVKVTPCGPSKAGK